MWRPALGIITAKYKDWPMADTGPMADPKRAWWKDLPVQPGPTVLWKIPKDLKIAFTIESAPQSLVSKDLLRFVTVSSNPGVGSNWPLEHAT